MSETVTFDHYSVMQRDDGSPYELGRGAMGITYKAFDTNLRIPVALKVINSKFLDSDIARQRFVREARAAAKLRHRHVASVFHLAAEGENMFYAMEFIDGETVDALIKRQGPLAPLLALQIVDQVARALNAAQVHGLVHRDIKPANLMLIREDDELTVKVIDFGLAKTLTPGAEDAATISQGGFVGTPHFASPEQLEEREIDVRSDIYSLGVTLWYMLAGQTPFAGSMAQVMSQHLAKAPPFERLANVPPAVAAVLRRMLEKEREARPQTPSELRQEIEKAVAQTRVGGPADPLTGPIDPEDFATVLEDAPTRPADTTFKVGSIAAGRYNILTRLGDTNTGVVFRAQLTDNMMSVRMLVLHRELTLEPATATQIEREVERAMPVEHPNLLRVLGIEAIDGASFITMEWTEGFSLLEVLRARRELEAVEVLKLLEQAAAGVDHAIGAGVKRLDLALHQIFIHFAAPFDKHALLHHPVTRWPDFVLKLNPLGITRDLSASETWSGEQTVVGRPGGSTAASSDSARAMQSLGSVVYELLGGTLSPLASGSDLGSHYTPLANLSE
ncbi:MAG: protein kinase, partial [Chthoniobacteraceae bacterium]